MGTVDYHLSLRHQIICVTSQTEIFSRYPSYPPGNKLDVCVSSPGVQMYSSSKGLYLATQQRAHANAHFICESFPQVSSSWCVCDVAVEVAPAHFVSWHLCCILATHMLYSFSQPDLPGCDWHTESCVCNVCNWVNPEGCSHSKTITTISTIMQIYHLERTPCPLYFASGKPCALWPTTTSVFLSLVPGNNPETLRIWHFRVST